MLNLNSILTFFSAIVLLVVACIFGFMARPTEMGLAILAGSLGMAFSNIDKISEFSGAGFSAKMRDQLQAVIDKETEPDIDPEQVSGELPKELINLKEQDEHAEDALRALTDSKYTWRSVGGVAKATSQRTSDALNTLELLQRAGLATEGSSNTGSRIWRPSVRGSIIGSIIKLQSTKPSA